MQDLTLQQLFGRNATQTAETLTIHKADLPRLSVVANNRGEQLLVALVLQAHQHFEGVLTDEQGRVVIDSQGRSINYDNRVLYEKLNISFWQRQFFKSFQNDIFVVDIFIKPPTEPGIMLNPNTLVY